MKHDTLMELKNVADKIGKLWNGTAHVYAVDLDDESDIAAAEKRGIPQEWQAIQSANRLYKILKKTGEELVWAAYADGATVEEVKTATAGMED